MNDGSRFGMAKSFVMMGKEAGFAMDTKEGLDAFAGVYNTSLRPTLKPPSNFEGLLSLLDSYGNPGASGMPKRSAKEKHKRIQAKASRKKNRNRK